MEQPPQQALTRARNPKARRRILAGTPRQPCQCRQEHRLQLGLQLSMCQRLAVPQNGRAMT